MLQFESHVPGELGGEIRAGPRRRRAALQTIANPKSNGSGMLAGGTRQDLVGLVIE